MDNDFAYDDDEEGFGDEDEDGDEEEDMYNADLDTFSLVDITEYTIRYSFSLQHGKEKFNWR